MPNCCLCDYPGAEEVIRFKRSFWFCETHWWCATAHPDDFILENGGITLDEMILRAMDQEETE